MSVVLRDGSRVEDPRLDRLVQFDDRSRNYAAVDLLESDQTAPRNRAYPVSRWFDQGYDGACVGFSFTHELAATPKRVKGWTSLSEDFARKVYWEAQKIDPWEGGSYPGAYPRYEGTSALAGVQAIQRIGWIEEYRWAFGEEDLALAVSWLGPAVIGINWYEGMYEPNSRGYIEPTGQIAGGHAILVQRINVTSNLGYAIWNSWGKGWGRNGWAYLSREHMARLLSEDGEACIPTRRSYGPSVIDVQQQL